MRQSTKTLDLKTVYSPPSPQQPKRPKPVPETFARAKGAASVDVAVSAKVIAAGIVSRDGGLRLRVALVLAPEGLAGHVTDPAAPHVALTDWPMASEQVRLDKLRLCFSPVSVERGRRSMPGKAPSQPQPAVAGRRLGPAPTDSPRRAEIVELWQRLIAPCVLRSDPWLSLAARLAVPTPGPTLSQRPAVVAVPKAEAAALIAFKRARDALQRLPHGKDSPQRGAFPAGWDQCGYAPWMGPLGRPACNFDREAAPPSADPQIRADQRKSTMANWKRQHQDDLDKALKPDREASEAFLNRRLGYEQGTSAPLEALGLGCANPLTTPPASMACDMAACQEDVLRAELIRIRNLHVAATDTDPMPDAATPAAPDSPAAAASAAAAPAPAVGARTAADSSDEADASATRSLMALQSQPALQRLFNLTIDLDIPLTGSELLPWLFKEGTTFADACTPQTGAEGDAGRCCFVYLGAGWGEAPNPTVWTTAKLRLPAKDCGDADGHFWPCTREEIDLRVAGIGARDDAHYRAAIGLREGVVDLGAMLCDGHPRWDIVTLDPMAIETELQASSADLAMLACGGSPNADARPTLRTFGLALVDRARQKEVIDEELAHEFLAWKPSAGKNSSDATPVVLDAKSLRIGYRMDVGVPVRGRPGPFEWRSLHERDLKFADPRAHVPWLDAAIRDCFRHEPGNANMLAALCSGFAAPMQRDREVTTGGGSVSFVEEIVAHWQGDPMGVGCMTAAVNVDARTDLALDISYDLPSKGGRRPPLLRLGWRYRLGLRPVFLGGVALPIESASCVYERVLDGSLASPPRLQGARRFLRHERVEAPMLALVKSDVEEQVRLNKHPVSGASVAIVRSVSTTRDKPFATLGTARVLAVPGVAQAFASLHGVFDKVDAQHPPDGFRTVDFDAKAGGFPVLGCNGAIVRELDESSRGDAVFAVGRPAGAQDPRPHPYYPDPAARVMVFALRSRSGDACWLPGKALELDLYPHDALRHPNPCVVLLEVVADQRETEASQRSILVHDPLNDVGVLGAREKFTARSLANWTSAAGTPALRVRVLLSPGEDLDLCCWCGPDAPALMRWFDIVESAAIICASSACTELDSVDREAEMARGFEKLCGAKLRKKAVKVATDAGPQCGTGGLGLPKADGLSRLAWALYDAFVRRPNAEIGAVRTMRVLHAVARPIAAPCFVQPGDDKFMLVRPLRTNFHDDAGRETWLAANPPSQWDPHGWPAQWIPVSLAATPPMVPIGDPADHADAATDVLLGGNVMVELDTTGSLEIQGRMVCPLTGDFDDPSRGLSARDRVRDTFPANPQEVWGFDVDDAGNVRLPIGEVCMLRLDDLEPVAEQGARKSTLEQLDVLYSPVAVPLGTDGSSLIRRPTVRHIFSDTKARRVSLTMTASSRFTSVMAARDGTKPSDISIDATDTHMILLPSMRRPDRLDPKTLLPTFIWNELPGDQLVKERLCRVRVRLRRPWFSSGEGEMLGIVVWPPDLDRRPAAALAGNVAPQACNDTAREWRTHFTDAMLGRGGQYVTRWGADPIRKGPTPQGWFMPREVFRDLQPEVPGGVPRAAWIPDVFMPVPSGEAGDSASSVAGADAACGKDEFLKVSLLAYTPKFDWREEHWYVDLSLDPLDLPYPFVRLGLVRYQANAHPRLQVSEPVVEWVQLMPRRTASVEVGAKRGQTWPVTVVVRGRGSLRAGPDGALVHEAAEKPDTLQRHRPIVRMRVLRRDDPVDATCCSEADAIGLDGKPLVWDSGLDSEAQQPERTNEGLVWSHTFQLADNPLAAPGRYAIFLEEFERMRPASYYMEDGHTPRLELTVDIEAVTPLAETGPRFIARLPIAARTREAKKY